MITLHTKTIEDSLQINKVIKLIAVSKKYPLVKTANKDVNSNFGDFWALENVSLDVSQGEILGIIGRNGAGKTTLLNIICGVLSPTQGEVNVNGRVLGLFNLGVGFQDELTGRENIFLNGAIIGATRKELENKLSFIIEFSELGNFINMPLGTYSQGMRLRLGFSIVANLDFEILVIDEILAVGDTFFQNKCFERLMDFKRAKKTLIITTQNRDLIGRLCDKVALLDHGCLLFYGDPIEGFNRYSELLNKEKFFVGPVKKNAELVENTKKWADDISDWGKRLGTKEVVIESVEFIGRSGWKCNQVNSGDPLKIKVRFMVRNIIKEPHFGVAIFRNDGVYCYGPNTAFDGYRILELKPGKGQFILNYKELLLAPGEYRLSVAIWDKNEILAFDYHIGYYKLVIKGSSNRGKELLNIPFRFNSKNYLDKLSSFFKKRNNYSLDLILDNERRQRIETEGIKIESVKLLSSLGEEKIIFTTNESVKLNITFSGTNVCNKGSYLWIGIYRDDGIYCQGITKALGRKNNFSILFPKFPLLPGGYTISLGIWNYLAKEFLMYHYAIRYFRMVCSHQDYGTVYLEHRWRIGGVMLYEKRNKP